MSKRENNENDQSEVRKIQYSGKSSFTIALPKKWFTKQQLNAGDQLIVQSDKLNNLILSSNKKQVKEKKRTAIYLNESDDKGHIERKIIATYISGYN